MCTATCAPQVQPFNINLTEHGPRTCNRGEDWGTYKDVVNCNTCQVCACQREALALPGTPLQRA